ncbi:hypothetical protein R3P38DRAFT_3371410 [Favolaschia claudopus]|uniref:Uncharacterized protein n=1 Tax=Favolaschia claudopus TaxID=2862362 RepID=A0AAV9ZZ81_9AGAR
MASFNISELPNPLTPLAFFPPDIEFLYNVGIYVIVGTLGAYIWDLLSNLQNDYKVLKKGRIGPATTAYFFSRLWSFLYLLGSAIFQTFPLNRCNLAQLLIDICYGIAVPANCLLFYLRARAIFDRNPYLTTFFLLMWLSVVGTAFTVPAAVKAGTIGVTRYCITTSAKPYIGASAITPLVHDTTMFLAISFRLFGNTHVDHGFKRNFRAFLTGEYLPRFSRAILKDGQLYYLSAVTVNLIVVAMFYEHSLPDIYRTMFTTVSVMVTNTMAGLVFRNTKLGVHEHILTTSEMPTDRTNNTLPMFRRPVDSTMRSSIILDPSSTDDTTDRATDSKTQREEKI